MKILSSLFKSHNLAAEQERQERLLRERELLERQRQLERDRYREEMDAHHKRMDEWQRALRQQMQATAWPFQTPAAAVVPDFRLYDPHAKGVQVETISTFGPFTLQCYTAPWNPDFRVYGIDDSGSLTKRFHPLPLSLPSTPDIPDDLFAEMKEFITAYENLRA